MAPHHKRCSACLTLFILWFGTPLTAPAEDWPVPRGPSREPAPFQFRPSLQNEIPKEFLEDVTACTLYSGTSHLVEADGTIETITHEITRLNGRKGIERLGEYRNITYDPAYQTLTLHAARVHKANGRVVTIEPRHLQLRDLSTDYQIYDHEKQLIISFPSLEVGDTVEVKWTTRGKNPEHGGHFFTRYNFGDDRYPVVRDQLRVRLPKSRVLKFAAIGGKLEPAITEDGNYRTFHWGVTNRREFPQDENLISKEELRLEVACSTFPSWDEVGRWKRRLRSSCWECTPEIGNVVREVTKNLKTPLQKARALTYWVRRNIRYVASGEKHDFTPHAPSQVFANRYGDCKDQSQLLAIMLREAGVHVALATLGTLDEGQVVESVPSPWGTHAILLVTLDGRDHWTDPTVSLAAWDFLPREDRDRLCYLVDVGDNPNQPTVRLLRTPPLTPEANRIEQTTHVSIGADGSSRCVRTCVYHGLAALQQRQDWLEVPPGERRRLVAAELQDANSRARLRKLSIDDAKLKDFDQPVIARLEFEIPAHFNGEQEREASLSDSKVWAKLLAYNLDYERQVPMQLAAPCELIHRYEVRLPTAYLFESLPKSKIVGSPWGAFTLTVDETPGPSPLVKFEFRTRLEKTRIDVRDFEDFRTFHEAVSKDYRAWLTLKPVQEVKQAPALEALLHVTPDDKASALILAKLYVENAMLQDARRVLQRAKYYAPNDRALMELTLKAASTPAEEETAYRALIKQFPDESKYAVSFGASLINRGEYAAGRAILEPVIRESAATWRGAAHYQLARAHFLENDAAKALTQLEAAAKASSEAVSNVAALQLKGLVHEKLGNRKEAAAAFRQAAKLDPDAKEPQAGIVRLALAEKNRKEALDALRRYTALIGDDVDGLVTAARFHLRLNRYEDAFELATRAQEQRQTVEGHRTLGLVYLHRSEYRRAITHLEEAKPDARVIGGLIRAYVAIGKLREAEREAKHADTVRGPTADLRRAQELVQGLVERRAPLLKEIDAAGGRVKGYAKAIDSLICAEHARAEGRPADRVEALMKGAFVEGLKFGSAHALRGQLALERGRLTQARVDAERALALAPLDARAFYIRGRVRLELMESGALADLEQAAKLSGRKDGAVLHWLATALAREGRTEEALVAQREAVKLKPEDQELVEQLRELENAPKGGATGR